MPRECAWRWLAHSNLAICADFLAGTNLDNGNPDLLLHSVSRFFKFLPGEQRQAFVEQITEKAS